MVVRAEKKQVLPADTRINVRYGGNPDGEPYQLGMPRTPQAVSCMEDNAAGGVPNVEMATAGAGGNDGESDSDDSVFKLRCGLYTQGPARLDVTATGYEPIKDEKLSFETKDHCEVEKVFTLVPVAPDAGM